MKEKQKRELADIEKNYSGWKPRLWSGNGKILELEEIQDYLPYDIEKIYIYVNQDKKIQC